MTQQMWHDAPRALRCPWLFTPMRIHSKLRGSYCVVQYIFQVFCGKRPGDDTDKALKVGELNALLDKLADRTKLEEKAEVLRALMQQTTPLQMKFITHIILGDLKARLASNCILSALGGVPLTHRVDETCFLPTHIAYFSVKKCLKSELYAVGENPQPQPVITRGTC